MIFITIVCSNYPLFILNSQPDWTKKLQKRRLDYKAALIFSELIC